MRRLKEVGALRSKRHNHFKQQQHNHDHHQQQQEQEKPPPFWEVGTKEQQQQSKPRGILKQHGGEIGSSSSTFSSGGARVDGDVRVMKVIVFTQFWQHRKLIERELMLRKVSRGRFVLSNA